MLDTIEGMRSNVCLKRWNTWHIGGAAEYFYQPPDLAALQAFLARHTTVPKTVLGLGSNVLVPDAGLNGVVLHLRPGLGALERLSDNVIYAQSGVTCAKLAKYYAQEALLGGAFFAGIPGTLGGALAMNAGAFGGQTWSQVVAVDVLDNTGQLQHLPASAFTPGYRTLDGPKGLLFVAAYLSGVPGETQTVQEQIKQLLLQRKQSQPIGSFNCGSVFKNPIGTHAAYLIEQAHLKGHRVGGAIVSQKHANFIVNLGDASAADVLQLIAQIKDAVATTSTIQLETEVKILG